VGPDHAQKNDLTPWQEKPWVIPPQANAAFVCAMEDVLEVYPRPYDARRPQVCLDETSKPLVADTREPIPAAPGQSERVDDEYERKGPANLFMVFEPLAGPRQVKVTERRTAIDFAHVIQELVDVQYPQVETIVLVMDHLHTHTPASLYEACAPAEARRLMERLELHYTPTHGS
jgi:DDE superfamily endonuclease